MDMRVSGTSIRQAGARVQSSCRGVASRCDWYKESGKDDKAMARQDELLIKPSELQEFDAVPSAERFVDSTATTCEACGEEYEASSGYYQSDEYSYCSDCCHW